MATAKAKKPSEAVLLMNELLLRNEEFVVLDVETTGFMPDKGGFLTEIGAVRVRNGKIVDTFSQLINPGIKIPSKIVEKTKITDEMVADQPRYGQVLPQLYKFIGDSVVVAHKAEFDWDRMLTHYFKKVGIIAKNALICTLKLSRMYYPYRKTHTLGDMCEEVGIVLEDAHRALNDAVATAKLLLKYKETHASKFSLESAESDQPVHEQFSLFELPVKAPVQEKEKEVPKSEPVSFKTTFKIKRVRYWEKDITKQKKMQRIYVTIATNGTAGNVYFDIPSKTWYNKDVEESIDFNALSQAVLAHLKLKTTDDLCNYRS